MAELRRAEDTLRSLFGTYKAGTRLEQATGKKLAEELRGVLKSLVDMTHAMDAEQIKRILRAIKKAFEVVIMIKAPPPRPLALALTLAESPGRRTRARTSASSRRPRPTTPTWTYSSSSSTPASTVPTAARSSGCQDG